MFILFFLFFQITYVYTCIYTYIHIHVFSVYTNFLIKFYFTVSVIIYAHKNKPKNLKTLGLYSSEDLLFSGYFLLSQLIFLPNTISLHLSLFLYIYLGTGHNVYTQVFSCVPFFVTPRTVALQPPLSMGFPRQ